MLSRVAERIYWMARYLERVENTARLVSVYGQLLLDLPGEARLDWSVPLEILGLGDTPPPGSTAGSELYYLLADPDNIASLLSSVRLARENARTTRDVVPLEAWQAVNEMHLWIDSQLPGAARRQNARLSAEIVRRCNEITGILEGGMSHGPAYRFVCLGRSLERADMTSRIIDVAAATLMAGPDELQHYSSTVWRSVLRAVSAYQMYRQFVRRRIIPQDVLRFLLIDPDFPRSVSHCVEQIEGAASMLPRGDDIREQAAGLRSRLADFDLQGTDDARVHRFVDDLQLDLAALHRAVFETWLNPSGAA